MSVKVLVIGNGGREHALAWKLSQSPHVDRIFAAPGNSGTAQHAENVDLSVDQIPKLVQFAKENRIDLTVAGPEAPLVEGLIDAFEDAGLRAFGPSQAASQLEGSKVFCKNLLRTANAPTADFQVFRDADSGFRYIKERYEEQGKAPVVVKADGLAAGKGAIVCSTCEDAFMAIDRIARDREFGAAGDQYIIEERLEGQEASILAITDGQTLLMLPPAQDHKPAFDNDEGPNTGGMGAYSPAPIVDDSTMHWVEERVFVPTIHAMKRSRRPFKGVLYAGLMLTRQGPKVLEYNVRFGDPECQPLMMRLQGDLYEILDATVDERLEKIEPPQWDPRPSVCVVMASEGYPGGYQRGRPIRGIEQADQMEDVKVFHAGAALSDGQVVTDGGRVLGVAAVGHSIAAAKLQAYKAVQCIRWQGAWCRKDISDKARE